MSKKQKKGYLDAYVYQSTGSKKIKGKKIKDQKRNFSLFSNLFIILMVVTVLFCANLLASFITPPRLGVEAEDKFFEQKKLYAIELSNYTDVVQAINASNQYKAQLAAGYVFNDKGTYRVFASAYLNNTSAQGVLQNLKDSGVEANIFVIVMPRLNMKLDLTLEQKNLLKEGIELFYKTYLSLYDLSLSLDKSDKTIDQIKIEVIELLNSTKEKVEELNTIIPTSKEAQVIYSKIFLNMLLEDLESLSGATAQSNLYSSHLKESYFKAIYNYINLTTELYKS